MSCVFDKHSVGLHDYALTCSKKVTFFLVDKRFYFYISNLSIDLLFFLICRMQEALNYLSHAYETNNALIIKGEKRGMDKSLIAVYRRKCLMVSTASMQAFIFNEKKRSLFQRPN